MSVYEKGEYFDVNLDEDILNTWLRPPSKQDLIRQGKFSHHRQQKIVGGMPVQYGKQAPWTVRYFLIIISNYIPML